MIIGSEEILFVLTLKIHLMFSVHLTLEKFEDATTTGYCGFWFGKKFRFRNFLLDTRKLLHQQIDSGSRRNILETLGHSCFLLMKNIFVVIHLKPTHEK